MEQNKHSQTEDFEILNEEEKESDIQEIKPKNYKTHIKIACIVGLCLAIVISAVLGFSIVRDTSKFNKQRLLSSGSTQIYDDHGNVVYNLGSGNEGPKETVSYDDLPQVLIDAVISAEDSRFFEHSGFDLPRIIKAAIGNIAAGGITSGGSTITQQLIKKTYFPQAEQTYTRKISEIILSIIADSQLSKEEIITLYLNKIYFGRTTDTIGIASACRYYFNKDVSELTLPEAAMLAGSLNSPYNYDPYYNLEKATQRRNIILNLMHMHGYITEEECELAKQTKVENTLCYSHISQKSDLSAYVDTAIQEVKERTGYDPEEVEMNIYTYLNSDIQKLCTSIGNGQSYSFSDEDMQIGACVQSAQDGRIVGIIGGRNYQRGNFNYAKAKQQPGSSVKPFLDYGLAFENLGWCTGQTIKDEPYEKNGFSPKNWDGSYHGTVTIENALENSWNIPAVKTFEEVYSKIGAKGITSAMESIGIDMSQEQVSLSSAIGGWTHGISPIEMTSAYATISNNGMYVESHTIDYIEIVQTGEIIDIDQTIQEEAKQSAYSEESAYMIRNVMTDYTRRGKGNYAYLLGIQDIGAKTGTSNWDSSKGNGMAGHSRDIWMSGFTSDYICSCWMGFGDVGIKKGKTTSKYKAYPGRVVSSILKRLQEQGTYKSYKDKPENVTIGDNEYYRTDIEHKKHQSISSNEETEIEELPEETEEPVEEPDANEPPVENEGIEEPQEPVSPEIPETPEVPEVTDPPVESTTPDNQEELAQ